MLCNGPDSAAIASGLFKSFNRAIVTVCDKAVLTWLAEADDASAPAEHSLSKQGTTANSLHMPSTLHTSKQHSFRQSP